MELPARESELFAPVEALIAESRRARAERDADWSGQLRRIRLAQGFGRSLLNEAAARLASAQHGHLLRPGSA